MKGNWKEVVMEYLKARPRNSPEETWKTWTRVEYESLCSLHTYKQI